MKVVYPFAFILTLAVVGCAPVYNAPQNQTNVQDKYSRTVNMSYDKTWITLVEYASSNYFAIDNFEKDSGLMTLNFGSQDPSLFVDCGMIKFPDGSYEGPFVEGIERAGKAELDGRMNLFIKPISANVTQVVVSARYVFSAKEKGLKKKIWTFDSGGSAVKNYGPTKMKVICQPTYMAEESLLNSLSDGMSHN